ncbi:MAG TPA: glycosyltransferase, partial [Chthoniobacterales bacterium]
EGATLLLYVGRLASEKNVKTLFAAFELLHAAEAGKWHLLAIGDGTQRGSLQALRERTGAVTWLPYCSEANQLAGYYRAADLFVHPGVCETFGLVTLESQASGTPVVGIKGSYMDRIIFTNQSHWAAENTPEALAAAIRDNRRQDLRAAGLAASEMVRARYSWRSVFDRLFGIYERVIAEYSP